MYRATTIIFLGLACLLIAGCDDGDAEATPDVAVDPQEDMTPEPEPDLGFEPDLAVEPDAGGTPDGGPDPAMVFTALQDAVDPARFGAEFEAIASAPRPFPYGENYQATAERCVEAFLEAGLEVTRQPLHYGGENIVGVLPGMTRAAEQVVAVANFDSADHCPGADVNASGAAGLLEAARVLGSGRYARTLVFACLGAHAGDRKDAYDLAGRMAEAGADVRAMLTLQNIAYTDDAPGSQAMPAGLELAFPDVARAVADREARGDFIFYASDDMSGMSGHIEAAGAAVGLPVIGLELNGPLRASEQTEALKLSAHRAFWEQGMPGTMLTDTGFLRNPLAECARGDDRFETVDVDFAVKVTRATVGALARAAEPAEGSPAEGRMVDAAPVRSPDHACDALEGMCEDGQRCALLAVSPSPLVCEPPAAMALGLDEPCERRQDGGDTCAAGLFCSFAGQTLAQGRRCLPTCHTSADCGAEQVCPAFGLAASNCVERCDPFGDDCGEGTTCRPAPDHARIGTIFYCGVAGPLGEGEACGEDPCGAGMTCTRSYGADGFVCRTLCQPSTAACGAGLVCRQLHGNGVPDDTGLCAPEAYLVD